AAPLARCTTAAPPWCLPGARAPPIQGSDDSQIAAQVGGCGIGRPLEIERRHEPARLVHEIHDGRVVHGVATLIERNLFEMDSVSLRAGRDPGRIALPPPKLPTAPPHSTLHH